MLETSDFFVPTREHTPLTNRGTLPRDVGVSYLSMKGEIMNGLLSSLTLITDFCAMTISLWLAFYLFGKGYPDKIALRAVVVFLSLAMFFFGAYDSQNHPTRWATELRAVAIVLTLSAWYS